MRDIKNFDDENFSGDVSKLVDNINQSFLSQLDYHPEQALSYFIKGFSTALNNHAPLKTTTRKDTKLKAKPWISKGILTSIQSKNAMFKKCYEKTDPKFIEKIKFTQISWQP